MYTVIVFLGLLCLAVSFFMPKNLKAKSTDMVKEMEETMEHFANEIEEENKGLLESVVQMKNSHDQQVAKLSDKIEQLEKQSYGLSQELRSLAYVRMDQLNQQSEQSNGQVAASAQTKQAPVIKADESQTLQMKLRYAPLFELHNQGKSIEYIAKKSGMNKGEVQLIIQLAKQEDQSRV